MKVNFIKARCIKTDPIFKRLEVGKVYDVKEYAQAYSVYENGDLLMGFSKERFPEHFEWV